MNNFLLTESREQADRRYRREVGALVTLLILSVGGAALAITFLFK